MKKISVILTISLLCTGILSGCSMFSSAIPEMTEEEEALVVEYATESLLRYDKKNGDKLGREPEEYKASRLEVVGEESPSPSPSPEGQNLTLPEEEAPVLDSPSIDTNAYADSNSGGTYYELEDALGISDELDLEYVGCSVEDTYPNSIDAYFIMNASAGKKLLVIPFKLTNITGSKIEVNLSDNLSRIKINVNGISKNALTTMLVNDLRYYTEDLEPGESDEVVLIGEFNADEVSSIDSLSIQITEADGTKSTLILK